MDAAKKRKILVTGASAGLGLAMTQLLLDEGYEVWGTSRRLDRLPKREGFHPVVMDLESDCSIAEAAEQVEREAGSLDGLVNNAGSGIFGRMESFPMEAWDQQWRVLVRGPYLVLREMLPLLRKSESGRIINVTSLAARFPIPMMGPYSMGKAALSALTQSLQLENVNASIRFVDLQPGDIRTDFNQGMEMVGEIGERDRAVRLKIDGDMAKAPSSEIVAKMVLDIFEGREKSPRVAVGDVFQAKIAPFLKRITPRSWVNGGIRKYYGI